MYQLFQNPSIRDLVNLTKFTSLWWDRVLEVWNRADRKSSLAGIGFVVFEVLDCEQSLVCIHWDSTGTGRRVTKPGHEVPWLSATVENWNAFIAGEFTAATGVFTRRLHYRGKISWILPYSRAFNKLAEVGNSNISGEKSCPV
jgi:hypothetical protein